MYMIRTFDMEQETEWLTTGQAAVIMGITPQAVQALCKRGGIECRRFGTWWQVSREAAENYEKTVGGRGKKVTPTSE